jgi:putative nucleotidyltransferase with HDIG domain
MNRDQAWQLVCEFTQSDSLRKHMLAVEFALRAYARHFGQDEEQWGIVGLLHDFDYERYPDLSIQAHPVAGSKILRERGWPEDVIHAVLSHAFEYTGVPRETLMEKALYAVDELTGLVTAVALVRPSKNIADVKLKSVKNKWKDKAFAAGVSRQDIEQGAAELGVELWEHVGVVLAAMQAHAAELGLAGNQPNANGLTA